MILLLLFFAAFLAAGLHWYIERPVLRATIGFFGGFLGSMILGVCIGVMIESGGNIELGKSVALDGFKNSLGTAIATLVFLAIAKAVIKRPPSK